MPNPQKDWLLHNIQEGYPNTGFLDPSSLYYERNQPGSMPNELFGSIGLEGLDPKFIKDPRFNYTTQIGFDPKQDKIVPGQGSMPLVLFTPRASTKPTDTAPIGAHSKLAVDLTAEDLAYEMPHALGPHPDVEAALKMIQGDKKEFTPNMARVLRAWMLGQRDRIYDVY